MDKNKKLAILLPVLAVISAIIWGANIKTLSKKEKPVPYGSSAMGQDEVLGIIKMYGRENLPIKSSFDKWGECPFAKEIFPKDEPVEQVKKEEPVEPVTPKEPDLYLGGIFWNKDKPCAIINNELVVINMTIEGYKVKSLTESSVVLSNGQNNIVLTLDKKR